MNELSRTSPISFATLLLYVPLLPRRRIFCYLPKYVLITEQIKSNRFLLFLIFIPPAIIQGVMCSQVLFVKRHHIHNSFLILFYGDLLANDRITNISIAIAIQRLDFFQSRDDMHYLFMRFHHILYGM